MGTFMAIEPDLSALCLTFRRRADCLFCKIWWKLVDCEATAEAID